MKHATLNGDPVLYQHPPRRGQVFHLTRAVNGTTIALEVKHTPHTTDGVIKFTDSKGNRHVLDTNE